MLYRQVRVGTVRSVGLTSDGGAVEAHLHIGRAFAELVRPETRFWNVGGFTANVGLSGITLQSESLETLLAGGVALATPPKSANVVRTGHRFELADEPQDDWLAWEPLVVIGSRHLPAGVPIPTPLRAKIGWKAGRWIRSEHTRQGWVLQTE